MKHYFIQCKPLNIKGFYLAKSKQQIKELLQNNNITIAEVDNTYFAVDSINFIPLQEANK